MLKQPRPHGARLRNSQSQLTRLQCGFAALELTDWFASAACTKRSPCCDADVVTDAANSTIDHQRMHHSRVMASRRDNRGGADCRGSSFTHPGHVNVVIHTRLDVWYYGVRREGRRHAVMNRAPTDPFRVSVLSRPRAAHRISSRNSRRSCRGGSRHRGHVLKPWSLCR